MLLPTTQQPNHYMLGQTKMSEFMRMPLKLLKKTKLKTTHLQVSWSMHPPLANDSIKHKVNMMTKLAA
jgi:hypothetical protein